MRHHVSNAAHDSHPHALDSVNQSQHFCFPSAQLICAPTHGITHPSPALAPEISQFSVNGTNTISCRGCRRSTVSRVRTGRVGQIAAQLAALSPATRRMRSALLQATIYGVPGLFMRSAPAARSLHPVTNTWPPRWTARRSQTDRQTNSPTGMVLSQTHAATSIGSEVTVTGTLRDSFYRARDGHTQREGQTVSMGPG